jgi:hypothetical protein
LDFFFSRWFETEINNGIINNLIIRKAKNKKRKKRKKDREEQWGRKWINHGETRIDLAKPRKYHGQARIINYLPTL